MPTNRELSRIYQGRVSKVQVLQFKGDGRKGRPTGAQDLHNWEDVLWRHHEIFQDAVNYYLVALGALADPKAAHDYRVIRDLRGRLEEGWERFSRPGAAGRAKGLRESLAPWIGLQSDAVLQDAFDKVLGDSSSDPRARCLALMSLLADLGGEGRIQQGGREYLPYFCKSKTKANFPRGHANQLKKEGKDTVPTVLWTEPDGPESGDLERLKNSLRFEYFAKPASDGHSLSPEDSKTRLKGAVDHLVKQNKLDNPEEWYRKIEELNNVCLPAYGAVNKETLKDRFFAWLVFHYLEQSKKTLQMLRSCYKKPGSSSRTKKSNEKKDEIEMLLSSLGEDPIWLARGDRGYVFSAFTALPAWHPASPGEPRWVEFDIAAFKEALKALNQFSQKTLEREHERAAIETQIAWMTKADASRGKQGDDESEEEHQLPKLAGDERYTRAQELQNELSQTVLMGNERFHVTRRSLRGLREIADRWNKLVDAAEKKRKAISKDDLTDVVKKYQAEENTQRDIGSIPLFLALCQEKYWPLWREGTEEARHELDEAHRARNVLTAVADLNKLRVDLEKKTEPISLTPAEPIYSRRLFCFSDTMGQKAKSALRADMNRGCCEVDLALQEGCEVQQARARLVFSAPRLHRDEILGGKESRWLQPMMAALGFGEEHAAGRLGSFAVSLMPDIVEKHGRTRRRFLLNFATTVDASPIAAAVGKQSVWHRQFNGTRDRNIHLLWPSTWEGRTGLLPWWENAHVIQSGLTILANDLGQRSAGAWAFLRMTTVEHATTYRTRHVGTTNGTSWTVERLGTGVYRLPGENEQDSRLDNRFPTKRGRRATRLEYQDAMEIAKSLGVLADGAAECWLGRCEDGLTFPEQNDQLIKLANRRLSRLSAYHQWSCFDPTRSDDLKKRERSIASLATELQAHETERDLLDLLEAGDFPAFRNQAGSLFSRGRQELEASLVAIADRVVPLRDRTWRWIPRANGSPYGDLIDCGAAPEVCPKIMSQRGLSLKRLEQLSELRRLFLRYNRALDREPGQPVKFGSDDRGRNSGEPCQILLDKIDRMKNERIDLTAHTILAQALGLRLKKGSTVTDGKEIKRRDLHGEYERMPGRTPVDLIVFEDLGSYRMSHDRGPGENKKLMTWAHRAVLDKIKELAEPFGIPILEVPAAYSSKFDAATGVPGFRAFETHDPDDYRLNGLRKAPEGTDDTPENQRVRELLLEFESLREANKLRRQLGKPPYTLVAPQRGGPLFIPIGKALVMQADINAAVNLGLRAVAAPDAFDIHRRIRAVAKAENGNVQWLLRAAKGQQANVRERAAFRNRPSVDLQGTASRKLSAAESPNFFYDPEGVGHFDKGTVPVEGSEGLRLPVCSGVALWASVGSRQLQSCIEINQERLDKWGLTPHLSHAQANGPKISDPLEVGIQMSQNKGPRSSGNPPTSQ